MEIIGWIRELDTASCGGVVSEGDQCFRSMGRPYAFQGARMACTAHCVIAEGYTQSTLTNRRSRVIHGMKTSGGCPLISSLNDRDGVRNGSGQAIPLSFALDENAAWIGDTFAEQVGKRFLVRNSDTGELLVNRPFIALVSGVKQEGMTDKNGYAHVDAKEGDAIELHLVYQAPTGPLTYQDN
jgi:uncharacterized Zn-binding protein involved in type VI secretion